MIELLPRTFPCCLCRKSLKSCVYFEKPPRWSWTYYVYKLHERVNIKLMLQDPDPDKWDGYQPPFKDVVYPTDSQLRNAIRVYLKYVKRENADPKAVRELVRLLS